MKPPRTITVPVRLFKGLNTDADSADTNESPIIRNVDYIGAGSRIKSRCGWTRKANLSPSGEKASLWVCYVPELPGNLLVVQDAPTLKEYGMGLHVEEDGYLYWETVLANKTVVSATEYSITCADIPATDYSGYYVEIVSGTGKGQLREIDTNESGSLTVTEEWRTIPNTTSVFSIKWHPEAKEYDTTHLERDKHFSIVNFQKRSFITSMYNRPLIWKRGQLRYAGINAPIVAPTLEARAGGSLTGTYEYVYTYCTPLQEDVYLESPPSPATSIVLAAQDAVFQGISTSHLDTYMESLFVTHVRIYRRKSDWATYSLVGTYEIGDFSTPKLSTTNDLIWDKKIYLTAALTGTYTDKYFRITSGDAAGVLRKIDTTNTSGKVLATAEAMTLKPKAGDTIEIITVEDGGTGTCAGATSKKILVDTTNSNLDKLTWRSVSGNAVASVDGTIITFTDDIPAAGYSETLNYLYTLTENKNALAWTSKTVVLPLYNNYSGTETGNKVMVVGGTGCDGTQIMRSVSAISGDVATLDTALVTTHDTTTTLMAVKSTQEYCGAIASSTASTISKSTNFNFAISQTISEQTYFVKIISTDSGRNNQIRLIKTISATAASIEIHGTWASNPTSADYYYIFSATAMTSLRTMIAWGTAIQYEYSENDYTSTSPYLIVAKKSDTEYLITAITSKTTPNIINVKDTISTDYTQCRAFKLNRVAATTNVGGTAVTPHASTSKLQCNAFFTGWGNKYEYICHIIGGTGAGQFRQIVAIDSANVISLDSAWDTKPDATSIFAIYQPHRASYPYSGYTSSNTILFGTTLTQIPDLINIVAGTGIGDSYYPDTIDKIIFPDRVGFYKIKGSISTALDATSVIGFYDDTEETITIGGDYYMNMVNTGVAHTDSMDGWKITLSKAGEDDQIRSIKSATTYPSHIILDENLDWLPDATTTYVISNPTLDESATVYCGSADGCKVDATVTADYTGYTAVSGSEKKVIESNDGSYIKLKGEWTTPPVDAAAISIYSYPVDNVSDTLVLASENLLTDKVVPCGFALAVPYNGRMAYAGATSYRSESDDDVTCSITNAATYATITNFVPKRWWEGHEIRFGSDPTSYTISYVDSTKVHLTTAYEGTTASGVQFSILGGESDIWFSWNGFSNAEYTHPLYNLKINAGDGDIITGVVPFQGRLLKKKKRSMYLVTGGNFVDPLDDTQVPITDFEYRKLPVLYGNVSPKTLCVDPNGSAWGFAGTGGIWNYDGTEIRSLSDKRITEFLASLDSSKFSEASGGFNPEENRYYIGHLTLQGSTDYDIMLWIDKDLNSWGVYDKLICPVMSLLTSG